MSGGDYQGGGRDRSENPWDRILLQAVDAGLASILFVAPLVMGGRHPLGRLVLLTLIALTTTAWLLRLACAGVLHWRLSGAEWLLAAGLGLVMLQLIPLPTNVLHRISPGMGERLPLWVGGEQAAALGTWSTISLMPVATQNGLAMYLGYAMLFLVTFQRLESKHDLHRLLYGLAAAATLMAAIGLLQLIAGNGKFLWIYSHPKRDTWGVVKATFSNENHLAHFLALGLGPILWCVQRHLPQLARSSSRHFGRQRSEQSSGGLPPCVPLICLAVVAFAGLLSLSRGGLLVLFVSGTLCLILLVQAGMLGRRSLMLLAASGILVAMALAIHGYRPLVQEWETVRTGALQDIDQGRTRSRLWSAVLAAARDYPLLGTGVGTHVEVYQTYFDEKHTDPEFTHAESGYLQVLEETGIVGLLLLLSGIGLGAWWCWTAFRSQPAPEDRGLVAAIAGGLLASALHSIFDFIWYIPACMSLTVILAAAACALSRMARGADKTAMPQIRHAGWIGASVSCAVGSFMILQQVPATLASPHWDQYQAMSLAASDQPTRGRANTLGKLNGDDPQHTFQLMHLLRQAVQRNPRDSRAHLRLAFTAVRRFELAQADAENAIPLNQIRDAARASAFTSRQAQDQWLERAVGENCKLLYEALAHTRRALSLCPLHGEGYILLADLSFLDGQYATDEYLQQAQAVRPHAPLVLLVAGRTELLRSAHYDPESVQRAFAFWKPAFHKDPDVRTHIVSHLVMIIPPDEILREWQPDTEGLQEIYARYMKLNMAEQAKYIGGYLAQALEKDISRLEGPAAAQGWNQLALVHEYRGDARRSLECLRRALALAPDDFELHHRLAVEALEHGDFSLAVEQLQWCSYRQPGNRQLRDQLVQARRRQLESERKLDASTAASGAATSLR